MPPISPKQLQANRRNARRSTGPKTPEGKQRVRFNAIKHGLLARSVIVPMHGASEIPRQLEDLLAQLSQDLCPVGILEEMLVEKIAVSYWRLRRALRVEAGYISENTQSWRSGPDEIHPGTLSLPSAHECHNITRYESAIERQLYQAMRELERRQERRRAQAPAPASAEPAIEPDDQITKQTHFQNSPGEPPDCPNRPLSPVYQAKTDAPLTGADVNDGPGAASNASSMPDFSRGNVECDIQTRP